MTKNWPFPPEGLTYAGGFTNFLTTLISIKIADRSEAKNVLIHIMIFDAKLRFALLASLRSAIFTGIKGDNKLVIFKKGKGLKVPFLAIFSTFDSPRLIFLLPSGTILTSSADTSFVPFSDEFFLIKIWLLACDTIWSSSFWRTSSGVSRRGTIGRSFLLSEEKLSFARSMFTGIALEVKDCWFTLLWYSWSVVRRCWSGSDTRNC